MRRVALADTGCATAGVITALALPFGYKIPYGYALLGLALPALWLIALSLVGAHNGRIIDDEAGEYRKVINAGVYLIATLAIVSLAVSHDRSRVYLLLAMPGITVLDLAARYLLRSRLLRQRAVGRCMSPVVAVGHESAVADLIAKLREDANRGMTVVTACLAETSGHREVAGVPVYGGLNDITSAVREYAADTVAVLSCPEIDDIMLWQLEWDLQETGADLCVAPTLLELPRLQAPVQAAAGLPLLRLQTPQLSGPRRVITGLFDRCVAAVALALLSPALAIVAAAIRLSDKGPVLVTQTRVGRGDRAFRLYKFRTMALDAEERQVDVAAVAATGGIALKTRRDPRVTPIGAHLERWSLDELPEFFNVLRGDMSLVGPLPALPEGTGHHAEQTHRKLTVKPGLISRSDRRLWLALGAVVVVAAGAITGILKMSFPNGLSGPPHAIVTPYEVGPFQREPSLEQQMKVGQLRSDLITSSSGQAKDVVAAVYQQRRTAPNGNPQIFMFIGGHLANADPAASIASFTQSFPGAKIVPAGPLGGEATCTEATTNGESVAMCVWFDNDSFGELVSPTMTKTKLASVMLSVRPKLELPVK